MPATLPSGDYTDDELLAALGPHAAAPTGIRVRKWMRIEELQDFYTHDELLAELWARVAASADIHVREWVRIKGLPSFYTDDELLDIIRNGQVA